MKVPPKRKGNGNSVGIPPRFLVALNESPSEKEGKYTPSPMAAAMSAPSMKVPPKRKGNAQQMDTAAAVLDPQ